MTDKQIIIDNIDVSGCKYYDVKKLPLYNCLECINHFKPCLGNNCYYKQLSRKEQECEELKNFHINLVGVKECEIKELVKYKQALIEIKEIAKKDFNHTCWEVYAKQLEQILEKISEVLDDN